MRKSGRARILGSIVASCLLLGGALAGAEAASATPANTVVATVSVGANPSAIAVTPNGRYVYVVAGSNSVSVIDTATNQVTTTIAGFSSPNGIAITPDGQYAYVSNYGFFGSGQTVSVIRISDNSILRTIDLGAGNTGPLGIAVTPDGAKVFVIASTGGTVATIRTSDDLVSTISGFVAPKSLALTPNGQYAYVTDFNVDEVVVIRTATNSIYGSPIPVGDVGSAAGPYGVTVTPDGNFVYVTNDLQNSVSVIRTSNNTVVGSPIATNSVPLGIAATPDGSSVLVALQTDNSVGVISTATNTITSTIPTGDSPASIAIGASGQYAYVSNQGSSSVSVINLLGEAPGPTAPQQAFGRVTGGDCVSGAPSWVDWPGVASLREVGWGASWAMWPNGGTGGYVCVRQPIYTTAGTWSIQ